jgi:hypothetical protein
MECLRCGAERLYARGLCRRCWKDEARNKNLDEWPRRHWVGADLIEEVEALMDRRADRLADVALCQRLGVTPAAVSMAASRLGRRDLDARFTRARRELRRQALHMSHGSAMIGA